MYSKLLTGSLNIYVYFIYIWLSWFKSVFERLFQINKRVKWENRKVSHNLFITGCSRQIAGKFQTTSACVRMRHGKKKKKHTQWHDPGTKARCLGLCSPGSSRRNIFFRWERRLLPRQYQQQCGCLSHTQRIEFLM